MSDFSKRVPHLVAVLVFVGLIGAGAYLNRRNSRPRPTAAGPAAPDALARYGFRLTEVSKESGIEAVHSAPRLDPKLEPILPRINDMGAGVAVADFDRDGWPDFYLTSSGENSKNRLYHNLKDGRFEEIAEKMGVADLNRDGTGSSMGAVWGDYDNDGFEDLLVYKWGRAELFHNDAGKGFTSVTQTAGLPAWMNCNTAVWLDFDSDGKLDLLMCGYFDEKLDLWHLADTKIMPDSLEYATNGTPKHLLKGDGAGRFIDITAQAGLTSKSWTLAIGAADLRGTGYPDIFLANDYGVNELWLNESGERLRSVGHEAGVGERPKAGMNVAFGDILNTGQFSIYVSNITSQEGSLLQGNNLWVLKPGLPPGKLAYDEQAASFGVLDGGWSFGAQFGDLNNDGFQDIYLVNGYISADRGDSYWYDYSRLAGANKSIIHDAANWPPLKGRSLDGFQQKRVWLNDGAGKFNEVAQAVGATDYNDGRSVALADLWNRGCLDVLVANQKGPFLLYKNDVEKDRRWIGFDLEGTRNNRSAIGAVVTLHWGGQKQSQVVSGGIGFCAQNDRRLHFGLGKNEKVDRVEIRWPGGRMQVLESLAVNQWHKVKES